MASAPAMVMAHITHILVAVDFEDASAAALAYARTLASRFGASLTLVHVYDDLFARAAFTPEVYGHLTPGLREDALHDLQERLAAMLTPAERAAGGNAEVLSGPTSKAIVEYAAGGGVDLIVMGTHGRRGISHAVLGSVAGQVLRTASCPVLTVRWTAEAARPLVGVRVATAQ